MTDVQNTDATKDSSRLLLNGDEAIAYGAISAGLSLATGYPGTPSTEIMETLSKLGAAAQWSPNEKVALEVAIGAAFGGVRALTTMKHVGLNVAADPFFSAAYTGIDGALVIVSADDPGMSSSQNEQDNRRYALFAGVPMFEPSDSQEAYDLTRAAFRLSEDFQLPVLLRITTRVCHSKSIVQLNGEQIDKRTAHFLRQINRRVMIPAHARPAHRRLREKLEKIAEWNETFTGNLELPGKKEIGIITSGISYSHLREAAPDVSILKLSCTYPLPLKKIGAFVSAHSRCLVIEEGDPVLVESLRSASISVEQAPQEYRFGELNVQRIKTILSGEPEIRQAIPGSKPPELCPGCPHRKTFEILRDLGCIVVGDIGCYTLGALPPFEAMDSQLCMGASIGMGAGLKKVLPEEQARKVVSVIGDSTFIHSGMTGLAEVAYNTPPLGHTVIILDNSTTAMTGLQEHPATGKTIDHKPARKIVLEELARALGIENVQVIDPLKNTDQLKDAIAESLAQDKLSVIIARRSCLLALKRDKKLQAQAEKAEEH